MGQSICLNNSYVEVNGHDQSRYVRSATLNIGSELLDDTNMGDTTKVSMGGMKTWSLAVTFSLEGASSCGPEVLLQPLVGTTACMEYRVRNDVACHSNPVYSGICVLDGFPLGGGVGTHAEASVTFQSAGTLARATST